MEFSSSKSQAPLDQSLSASLPLATQLELIRDHGVDPDLFASWAIKLGVGPELEGYDDDLEIEVDASTTHGQTGRRAKLKRSVDYKREQAEGGWSFFQ